MIYSQVLPSHLNLIGPDFLLAERGLLILDILVLLLLFLKIFKHSLGTMFDMDEPFVRPCCSITISLT